MSDRTRIVVGRSMAVVGIIAALAGWVWMVVLGRADLLLPEWFLLNGSLAIGSGLIAWIVLPHQPRNWAIWPFAMIRPMGHGSRLGRHERGEQEWKEKVMLTRIDRVQMAVPNRASAARGWTELLGAEHAGDDEIKGLGASRSRYRLGDGWIELLEPSGSGVESICFASTEAVT